LSRLTPITRATCSRFSTNRRVSACRVASWALVAGATALVLSAAAAQASRAGVSLNVSASLVEQFMPRTASRF
jgi:hypothetical protein